MIPSETFEAALDAVRYEFGEMDSEAVATIVAEILKADALYQIADAIRTGNPKANTHQASLS